MGHRHPKPEEIVAKLCQVEVLTGQGRSIAVAARSIGVSEQTYFRWRADSGSAPDGQTSASLTTPFGFTGMMLDAETRLYFDHARYYSPA